MTTYYVDPDATGSNNGSSWANAWTDLQSAADTATAGDIVYCRGTQNLAAAIDFDTNSGSDSAGYIKFIGCNASGVNDGTYFVLDGGSNAIAGITPAANMVWLENFKIQNCGNQGIANNGYADAWNLVNVWIHSNGGYGIDGAFYHRYWRLFRCRISSNTTTGIYRIREGRMEACTVIDNGTYGVRDLTDGEMVNCAVVDQSYGIYWALASIHTIRNCVIHSNTTRGLHEGSSRSIVAGCRFTANGTGYYTPTTGRGLLVGCYFQGNSTHIGSRYDVAPIDGDDSHVVLGGSDSGYGYVNAAADDFNLDEDASLRSVEVALP